MAIIEVVANRLRKRQRHLRKWARRQNITCYRLYERDIPDQPLIVDWYDGVAVVWCQRRTRNETDAMEVEWQADVFASVQAGLDLGPEQVHMKTRKGQRQEGSEQYERMVPHEHDLESSDQALSPHARLVKEQGIVAEVNVVEYLDTGMFLDHRPLRHYVQQHAAGKRVLNLFCYTGLFTVHAAMGQAARTVSVDLSNTYLSWAQRNLRHNGIEPGGPHRFVRHDVLNYLKQMLDGKQQFDMIICDPPTFSNSKKTKEDFQVGEHQGLLIDACMSLLAPGGTCFFSTNFRGFSISDSVVSAYAPKEISNWTVPEDFRNRVIHRCWQLSAPI